MRYGDSPDDTEQGGARRRLGGTEQGWDDGSEEEEEEGEWHEGGDAGTGVVGILQVRVFMSC